MLVTVISPSSNFTQTCPISSLCATTVAVPPRAFTTTLHPTGGIPWPSHSTGSLLFLARSASHISRVTIAVVWSVASWLTSLSQPPHPGPTQSPMPHCPLGYLSMSVLLNGHTEALLSCATHAAPSGHSSSSFAKISTSFIFYPLQHKCTANKTGTMRGRRLVFQAL